MGSVKKFIAIVVAIGFLGTAGIGVAFAGEKFKEQMLEQKKAILDQRVKDGELSQEQADEIYTRIEENQAYCNGTGKGTIGKEYGACFGRDAGFGHGKSGSGMHHGRGVNFKL